MDQSRFEAKVAYARSLLDRADMLLINEAHGTDGGNRAWRPLLAPLPGGLRGLLLGMQALVLLSKTPFCDNLLILLTGGLFDQDVQLSYRLRGLKVHWISWSVTSTRGQFAQIVGRTATLFPGCGNTSVIE